MRVTDLLAIGLLWPAAAVASVCKLVQPSPVPSSASLSSSAAPSSSSALPAACTTNVILNGDFSTGAFNDWGWGGNGDLTVENDHSSTDFSYYVKFYAPSSGSSSGGISQSFKLVAGKTYLFSFSYLLVSEVSASTLTCSIGALGTDPITWQIELSTVTPGQWITVTDQSFVAPASNVGLNCAFETNDGLTAYLTDIFLREQCGVQAD